MAKRPTPSNATVVTTVRMPRKLLVKLGKMASQKGLSRSRLLIQILDEHVDPKQTGVFR